MVASETAIRAGWAFSVSCKVSAGPSQIVVVSFSPSAASTSSNTARATGKVSANAFPMPTAWEPCPGKVNAAVINTPGHLPARPPRYTGQRKFPVYIQYFRSRIDATSVSPCGPRCQFGPKDTALTACVKRPDEFTQLPASAFPCQRAQNPYKPRHPWV